MSSEQVANEIFTQVEAASELRYNRLFTSQGELNRETKLLFEEAISILGSLNNKVCQDLTEMYKINKKKIKNNIILCHSLSFVSEDFLRVYALIQHRWKREFLTKEPSINEVKKWILDLSPKLTVEKSTLRQQYILSCFQHNDYTKFGYVHNDGYLIIDLRKKEKKTAITVIAFKKLKLPDSDSNIWLMYSCCSQFICMVKDHDLGLFLYQVCNFLIHILLMLITIVSISSYKTPFVSDNINRSIFQIISNSFM